ncbi:MAG: hypothetical protein L0Y38_11265 [Methylococcaceae bacterium]|nr:hypothetical protein [Methylococcaceae bacterium]
MAITQSALQSFARLHRLEGLSKTTLQALNDHIPGYSLDKARRFIEFQERIQKSLLQHRIITHNSYTAWFSQGSQNKEQIKAFIVQFSVFSNQFLLAQLNKMINADSLESMRASKEILANEIGVRFKSRQDKSGDEIYGSTEGSIEGSTFRFAAAHFEWLYSIARELGLRFDEIGRARHGTEATLFFCNELFRLYGGDHYQVSQAASFAVENWAAAGFWKQLIEGFRLFNQHSGLKLPLGFFIWHDRIETQHAEHTQEELENLYFTHDIDEDAFIRNGNTMLDGVAAFWDGLDEQRRELSTIH